jgi:predicted GIY-YIG superfamily endonuclease
MDIQVEGRMTDPYQSPGRTALYRLYDADDELLYVGITWNPKSRWESHATYKSWWHKVARKTVEWHEDRRTAIAAEARITAAEKPRYDDSARRSQGTPRRNAPDHEGIQKVAEALTSRIKEDVYPPGTRLSTGPVAQEYEVARTTASSAMHSLTKQGFLEHWVHGRFAVAPRSVDPQ